MADDPFALFDSWFAEARESEINDPEAMALATALTELCLLLAVSGAWRPSAPRPEDKEPAMIRKLKTGEYRLYSRKLDPKTGKRRNLGTFKDRAAAEKHERDVQYFKRHG